MTTTDALDRSRAGLLVPDGGEELQFLGASRMRFKYDAGSDGELAVYEYVSEPGVVGPPQHVHHGHDETFYVVAGTYEFTIGTDVVELVPGAFLSVPRETPHTFRNSGTSEGRIVGTFNPARFAGYFRELAEIIASTGGPPDRDAWTTLYARYDTTFYDASSAPSTRSS